MNGMQLSLYVKLDVMSQWVAKGLMGSMATSHRVDLHHIRDCRQGRWRCLSWPLKSEMVDEENAAQKWTGNHSRHIEWSHMATTHSVMRVSRPCCLSVDWGLQGQRLHCTFWCRWMQSGGKDKKIGNHFLLSWHCYVSEQDHRYGCWTIENC